MDGGVGKQGGADERGTPAFAIYSSNSVKVEHFLEFFLLVWAPESLTRTREALVGSSTGTGIAGPLLYFAVSLSNAQVDSQGLLDCSVTVSVWALGVGRWEGRSSDDNSRLVTVQYSTVLYCTVEKASKCAAGLMRNGGAHVGFQVIGLGAETTLAGWLVDGLTD